MRCKIIIIGGYLLFITGCNNFLSPQEIKKITTAYSDEYGLNNNSEVTFENIKASVIDKKCLSCHKPGGKAEDMPFTTKSEILNGINDMGDSLVVNQMPDQSLFYLSLLTDEQQRKGARKMPPPKAVKLGDVQDITSDETKLIEIWIKSGMR